MKSRKMVLPIPFEDGAGDGPGMVREDGARGMVQGWCERNTKKCGRRYYKMIIFNGYAKMKQCAGR